MRSTKKGTRSSYLDVVFSTQTDVSYRYFGNQVDDNLDLAYALTVHKAQGSDFEVVFLIIPQKASTLSRELIYTGLTRFRRKLVLLIEKDIEPVAPPPQPGLLGHPTAQHPYVHLGSPLGRREAASRGGAHPPHTEGRRGPL